MEDREDKGETEAKGTRSKAREAKGRGKWGRRGRPRKEVTWSYLDSRTRTLEGLLENLEGLLSSGPHP